MPVSPKTSARQRVRLEICGAFTLGALAAACVDPSEPSPAPEIAVAVDTSTGPLIRVVTVDLAHAASLEVTYGAIGTPVLQVSADSAARRHRLVLPRLRAARDYAVEVSTPGGNAVRTQFRTGVLPPDVAEIQLQATGEPSAPVALVEIVGAPRFTGLLLVEDAEVVGYFSVNGSLFGTARRSSGDIVLLDPLLGLVSRRLDGSLAHRLPQPDSNPGAAYGRIHHDLAATPGNTILFIANDIQSVEGESVVGEALWEWNPEAGTTVKRWSAFDHLDWRTERGLRSNSSNWLHGNGISYGPRGNIVMSLRNVDQVISISPDFSAVEWKMGGVNGTLQMAAEDRFYGQHYVSEPVVDRVLVYDNGFGRPGAAFTRAIEYQIDAAAGTATTVWQYRHAPDIYAALVGSALRLPNGNTMVLFGMAAGENLSSGPVTAVEVDPDGNVRWRLSVGPQLTRLYRVTPVSSLLGEKPGFFRGP